MQTTRMLTALCILLGSSACEDEREPLRETTASPETPIGGGAPARERPEAPGGSNEAAGITWEVPEHWEVQPKRPMRVATYKVPKVEGDPEAGEVGVFFFGKRQGGGIEANIDRWVGQMRTAEGGAVENVERNTETVGGVKVTTVDVSGTFMASTRPMGGETTPKPGFRLMAAIAEGPGGNVFFKLTAPEKTAEQADFEALVDSISKTSL